MDFQNFHSRFTDRNPFFLTFLAFIVTIFSFASVFPYRAYGTEGHSKPEQIVVATGNNFVPMIFLNDSGEPDGILADHWRLWSEKTGIEVELQPMAWANTIPALLEGDVDAVDGVTYTPERGEFLDMSSPHTYVATYIYFHESISGIRDLSDLAGFPVGILKGSHVEEHILRNINEIRLVSYINYEEMAKAAVKERLRVFVGGDPMFPFQLAKSGHRPTFLRNKNPILGNDIRVAVRKGDSAMLSLIEQGFSDITPEEKQRIRNNWSGVSLASQIPWKRVILAGIVIFTALILIFLWNFQLRKRVGIATKTLQESQEKYRQLVENANDAIFIIEDGIVKFPNLKTEEMTGYSEKELSEIPFINIVHPDDREMVLDRRKKRLSGEKPPSTYSFRMINKSGDELLVQINTVFISWAGKPATINIVRNVTEQKRLEAQLQQAHKMESVGLLAGGVAHDLNNVLSGIVSYPELLLLDLPEDSKLRKPIKTMQEAGHRATAIVQDLLTVARGVATTKEPLNLNDLVSEYLSSPEFKKLKQFHSTVTIEINLDSNLLNITGSQVHIRKVIMNLVSNAAEAIEGSGNVIVSTMNRYIDKPLRGYDDVTIGEYAVLTVSDDGSGISSGDLERIFDPFYTKKVMGRSGTGLGLSVVWNVVQDHEGYIDVRSNENGTIFELYFSITRDEMSDKALPVPMKDYKGNGEMILIVDDVESQRDISCKMLGALGYATKAVSAGEEAVEYLKENTADLILLDMIMDPGINGRETYERIVKIHPNQKAIITSGFAETDDVKEAQKLGAGQYIRKPLTLEKLGITVKDELKK